MQRPSRIQSCSKQIAERHRCSTHSVKMATTSRFADLCKVELYDNEGVEIA